MPKYDSKWLQRMPKFSCFSQIYLSDMIKSGSQYSFFLIEIPLGKLVKIYFSTTGNLGTQEVNQTFFGQKSHSSISEIGLDLLLLQIEGARSECGNKKNNKLKGCPFSWIFC